MSFDSSRVRSVSLYCLLGIASCALILISVLSNTAASDPLTESGVFQGEARKVLTRNKLVATTIECGPAASAFSCNYQANGTVYGPYSISEETAYLLEESPLREHSFALRLDEQGALRYTADKQLAPNYALETLQIEARVVLSETALKWAKELQK